MKAAWADRTATVASSEDLDAIVREIEASNDPTLLHLEAADGATLAVGVGRAESIALFTDANGACSHSLGLDRYRRGVIEFRNLREPSDFLAELAIPASIALAAAHEFVRTASRPRGIDWESDE